KPLPIDFSEAACRVPVLCRRTLQAGRLSQDGPLVGQRRQSAVVSLPCHVVSTREREEPPGRAQAAGLL
ncbi:unnamed protein product, partial [Symbiodinium microadriaticum]